jgi:hypothetical protein
MVASQERIKVGSEGVDHFLFVELSGAELEPHPRKRPCPHVENAESEGVGLALHGPHGLVCGGKADAPFDAPPLPPVRRAKLRDRGAGEAGGERITVTSAVLPKWARRTRSLDALLPVLYLRGISTGGFPGGAGRAPR